MSDDDRFARYVDDPDDPAAPEFAAGETLRDPAIWTAPPHDLEDRVVATVRHAHLSDLDADDRPSRTTPRWRPRPWLAVAGMAAATALVVVLLWPPAAVERYQLTGSDLAPEATAIALVESTPSGDSIRLSIDALPPAPAGSFYQAWVRGDRGLVSVGTFHLRGGDGVVELWSGVDLTDYPTLTVTIEPEDADQTSSGRVLISGRIAGE